MQRQETEDDCSRRVVREETRGKDDRARRGKVGHLRDDPPNTHRTICGVHADNQGARVVSGDAAWIAVGDLQCRNCKRMVGRSALRRPMLQLEIHCPEDPAFCDCAEHDNARRAEATHAGA